MLEADLEDPEFATVAQRISAGFGLAGLVFVWIVAIVPCALWLGLSVLLRRDTVMARPSI